MQIIIPFKGSTEDYVRNCEHLQVICPVVCPNCQGEGCLRKHGYYRRSVSSGECARLVLILISVRRFLCCLCRLTTSMLPDFAQPHRLVGTDTVSQYLAGDREGNGVAVWAHLLEPYRSRFEDRLPETRRALVTAYGFDEPAEPATGFWKGVCRFFGGARLFTARFARDLGMTVFGIYRCHQAPENFRSHTNVLFSGGPDPPCSANPHGNAS